MSANNNLSLFGFDFLNESNPRKLSFLSFIKSFLFPSLRLISFTSLITLIDIIIFIITISFGIEKNPATLLSPLSSTLDLFGMKDPFKQQHGQVWRFITYSILHANFNHLFSNVISQLIIVSSVEYMIGWKKSALLYLLIS